MRNLVTKMNVNEYTIRKAVHEDLRCKSYVKLRAQSTADAFRGHEVQKGGKYVRSCFTISSTHQRVHPLIQTSGTKLTFGQFGLRKCGPLAPRTEIIWNISLGYLGEGVQHACSQ
uniref:Uncharacterized protein n=2 Tax=Lepeophtheirus salmonis TaxID=72036 RepID=A0A0K2TJD6_LEPSM